MPTLEECKRMIVELAEKKGWGENPAVKIFYAIMELAEGGNIWKHRGDYEWLRQHNIPLDKLKDVIAEELIDTIFYCLHALNCLDSKYDADALFLSKFLVNKKRNRIYIDDEI